MTHPNQRLLDLIERHNLTQKQVAELCMCGRTAVYLWTREPDHPRFTVMKPVYLRLLELELSNVF